MATKKSSKQTKKSAKKKTAKKATKKKSTKKKSTKRKTARSKKKMLVCVNDERCFWTTDGQVLQSLTDLQNALKEMAEDVFKHHVTSEKNDFADWVQDVLGDRTLAASLRRSRKPHTARTVVVRRLKTYGL